MGIMMMLVVVVMMVLVCDAGGDGIDVSEEDGGYGDGVSGVDNGSCGRDNDDGGGDDGMVVVMMAGLMMAVGLMHW